MDMEEFRNSLKADIDDQSKKNQDASDRGRAHAAQTLKTFFELADAAKSVVPGLVTVKDDSVNEYGTYEVEIVVGSRHISFATAPSSGTVSISGMNSELNAAIPADFQRRAFVDAMRQSYNAVDVKLEQLDTAANVFANVIRDEARNGVGR